MPKYVVSSTLSEPDWNNTTIVGVDDIARLREDEDGVILVNGSRRLVDALVERDLVDELRLMVFPIVLGSGKQLFGDIGATKGLELVESRPVGPEGVLVLVYCPK
jgi:dihydrofolate reductase